MKLTPEIIAVLKNFSNINDGIRFMPGKVIDTISQAENVIAKTEIEEEIPVKFCIYDLNEFLSIVSLFKDPVLVFDNDKYVLITQEGSRSSVKYFFAAEETVKTFDDEIELPDGEVKFTLSKDDLGSIMKAASVLQAPEILVEGREGNLKLKAVDSADDTSNNFIIDIGSYDGEDCEYYFLTDTLRLIPADYNVELSSEGAGKFVSVDGKTEYVIGIEEHSKYGG